MFSPIQHSSDPSPEIVWPPPSLVWVFPLHPRKASDNLHPPPSQRWFTESERKAAFGMGLMKYWWKAKCVICCEASKASAPLVQWARGGWDGGRGGKRRRGARDHKTSASSVSRLCSAAATWSVLCGATFYAPVWYHFKVLRGSAVTTGVWNNF